MTYVTTYKDRQAFLAKALLQYPGLETLEDNLLKSQLASFVAEELEGTTYSLEAKQDLSLKLFHTMRGLDILEELLADPAITEIMVNSVDQIFIEKEGRLERVNLKFDDEDHLMRMINRCFARANRTISEQKPIASLRFKDGSRLQAVIPPINPDGPALSIRRFKAFNPSLKELIKRDSLSPEAAMYLHKAVENKQNIFVSGGTGTGKTSFLNALSKAIPRNERIVTIEDTAELDLNASENLLRLEAREPGSDGKGEVNLEDLIRTALRLRPDRIIVGEVRGQEAYAMIEAMRSGHPGSMSTGHANSPEDMIERLGLLLLLRLDLPWQAVLRMIYSSLDIIVQLERLASGKRQVQSINTLNESFEDFKVKTIFERQKSGQLDYVELRGT